MYICIYTAVVRPGISNLYVFKAGGVTLRKSGMKNFKKIYRDWVTKRSGAVLVEEDEPAAVPAYSSIDDDDDDDNLTPEVLDE